MSKLMKSVLSALLVIMLSCVLVNSLAYADQSNQELVTEIYVATFGRAPANAGLNYWTNAVDSGSFTIEQVAQSFFDQPETQAKFPEDSSNSEFITTIYYNVLNRAPAESGLAYWVAALDSGTMRRDQAIMAIINGAKAATGDAEDAVTLAKKTEIGVYFANSEIGTTFTADESFMDWATNIISFANSDDFEIEDAEDYISELLSEESNTSEVTSECGAYIAPGVWKEFDCYNLAAIGKTTGDDPFTPSWRLIGGYWQWGRKGPEESQWYDTNTANFAHGPTGPDRANSGRTMGWETSATDGSWSDRYKTENDPCPDGYRIPTMAQWQGVIDNNELRAVGDTWLGFGGYSSYNNAMYFGNKLMLPAAGSWGPYTSEIDPREGNYWSTTEMFTTFLPLDDDTIAINFSFYETPLSLYISTTTGLPVPREDAMSVRCISE